MLRSEVADPIQTRLDAQDMLDRQVVDYNILTKEDLAEAGVERPGDFFKEDGTPKANIKNIDADARDWLVSQGKLQTEIRTPTGDETYLHRLWDFTAIREEPDLFEAKIASYFYGKAKESIRGKTIGKVEARIETLETDLKILEAKVAKSKKKGKVVERTYAERQAELDKLKAKRKALKEAGDEEGAKAIKTPKRTDAQRAYDTRQEIKHFDEVELPNAQRAYDADIVVAKRQADNMAMDVRMKIEGEEYNPSMGADRSVYEVGPLKARTLAIPTEVISDFVENDIEKIMQQYVRGINPQLHFKETFDPASPSSVKVGRDPQKAGVTAFEAKMNDVQMEYEAKAKEATASGNKKEATKIRKEWTAVKRDMEAMQEVLFNKYKLPDNPSGFWHKARARLKEFNMMTMLGMMTISAIPDVGNYIARRGMKSFARDMTRLATNMKALKLSAQMNRRMGLSSDLMNSSRVEKMYAMDDQFAPISKTTTGGKILRGWKNTQNTFTQATGMPLWNNMWKNMAATSYIDDIAIDAMKLRDGTLSQHSIEAYARGGLGIDELTKIGKQLNKERDMIDGVWVPDIDAWTDQNIATAFKAAVRKEVDMTIVTPGKGDMPLNSRGETGKLIFQFKSFAMSANNRILLASLDDMTSDKVAGMMAMVALGYTSYAARQTLKGKEVKTDYDTFVREGLDRSGMLSIWGEANAMASKATSGEADMFRLLGADKATLTRYASRNMLSTVMGVSAGRVQDLGQLTSAIASGDFKESDIRAIRRTMIMNNLWFTHRGFTEIEKSLGGSK
jgi:Tfp pilus assembly major pilin PilA